MKAAVICPAEGTKPAYRDFPDPVVQNEDQLLISVKAAAIKNIDKSRASGDHYSVSEERKTPVPPSAVSNVPGGDGVGLLADGTRVFALGVTGMMAEKAVIEKNRMIKLPAGIDDMTAAALPNAVAGSAMALRFRASMKSGETILINGATGFTGKLAVQIAKYYGAKKIIVTGRNPETLKWLRSMGANEIISLQQDDQSFITQLKEIMKKNPVDVILDYLWGKPAEMILEALKGKGSFTYKTRFVSIGAVAGDNIQLSAAILRSVDLLLSGSGLGSWTKDEMKQLFSDIIPEMFQLAADKKLQVDTEAVRLRDIEKLWDMEIPDGKRMVVTI
jgi:NADPH:quinone reductase-like Zn-dependent oxidoreductase